MIRILIFSRFNRTKLECWVGSRFNEKPSIEVALRFGISVIAPIVLITMSLQQNKCNHRLCSTESKCHNALVAKTFQWQSVELFSLSVFASKRLYHIFSVSFSHKMKAFFFLERHNYFRKCVTPAPEQTMVGPQSSFTVKSLMKSGLRSRLIVSGSDFSADQGSVN